MKKSILITSLIAVALSTMAHSTKYPKNPVIRPLTLTESTVELTGAYLYGKQYDKDVVVTLTSNIAYGLTDDFQIGLDGITYSLFKNKSSGFELATQAGLRGYFEDKVGDSLGLGISLLGKQIINDNLAFTFGAGYSHWDIDNLDNKYEFDYSVGFLANIAPNLTLSGQYIYRDLKDFKQSHANLSSVGLNYTLTDDLDVGTTFTYSDFAEKNNNFALLETPETTVGAYLRWRF